MPPRRLPTGTDRREDVTGQAGWLYTGLLLGLMVIFMATASVIPESLGTEKPTAPVYSQNFEQIFEALYVIENTDAAIINQEVATFLATNRLPEQSVIVEAQFVGGYNASLEAPSQAIDRAVAFATKLDSEDSTILSVASGDLDSSSQLNPGEVIVRFKFAVLVQ